MHYVMPEPDASEEVLLSVIVPLTPEETEVEELLEQLTTLPPGSEVIVVRADNSSELPPPTTWLSTLIYREYTHAAGRARQLNLGTRVAGGHWLWFLHPIRA